MSSRWTASGDSRYPSRGRSPPRFPSDRRSSLPYSSSGGPRSGDVGPRSGAEPPVPVRESAREPPRGPKALVDGPPRGLGPSGGSFVPSGPRGRGSFVGRGDFRDRERDREPRDFRDSSFRGDRDRDRIREREFDIREKRLSPPGQRGRSPPSRDFRERDLPRDLDVGRPRRSSRDGAPLGFSDPFNAAIPSGRPSAFGRGRGRGDWDSRGRGRGSYLDERDRFRPRSRSAERRWDRDPRDDRDRDYDFARREDRRDEDRKIDRQDRERDEREREAERYRREQLPARTDARTTSGSSTAPPTPHLSASTSGPVPGPDSESARETNVVRRSSTSAASQRREPENPDYFSSRAEASRERYIPRAASPPQAPQVPAFGSLTYKTPALTPGSNVWRAPVETKPSIQSTIPSGPKLPPTGPKAQLSVQAPTGPKADTKDLLSQSTSSSAATLLASKPGRDETYNTWSSGTPSESLHKSRVPLSSAPTSAKRPVAPTQAAQSLSRGNFAPQNAGIARGRSLSPVPSVQARSNLVPGIPTGPKADRGSWGSKIANPQWVRPGGPAYGSRPATQLSGPRTIDDRPRSRSVERTVSSSAKDMDPLAHRKSVGGRSSTGAMDLDSDGRSGGLLQTNKAAIESKHKSDSIFASAAEEVPQSFILDDDLDENMDDDDGLDEEYFAGKEEDLSVKQSSVHTKLAALERTIDTTMLLATLHDDLAHFQKETLELNDAQADTDVKMDEVPDHSMGLPSPKMDDSEDRDEADVDQADDTVMEDAPSEIHRVKTPPVESLPFLKTEPLTPISELEVFQENVVNFEKIKEFMMKDLATKRRHIYEKEDALREEYARLYKPWRLYCAQLDEELKRKSVDPEPIIAAENAPQTPATVESRRGTGRNTTELDLDRILRESEQLAREESERRKEREAKTKPDLDKEAMIPDMLDESVIKAQRYQDTNGTVPAEDALAVFAFVPPVDDFTEEEHEVFTENFMVFPKKWGKIAEALPGRSFKECIDHYYLTKKEAKYKHKLNRRRYRSGRKRPPQTRQKPNALMTDLGVHAEVYDGDEADVPPVAITDAGRPRRAAAPTFGAKDTDTDSTTPAVTPGKRSEERSAKRAKTTAKDRGKKAKVPIAPSTTSPQKVDKEKPKDDKLLKPSKAEDDRKAADLEVANSLAALQSGRTDGPGDMKVLTEPQSFAASVLGVGQQPKTAAATTSYWSVPEQADFPKLVAHYGTDWVRIANYMKTKTPVMVKNQYQRLVESGRNDSLQQAAQIADERRARGEDPGQPPVPSIPQKRRYETPQPAVHRILAPNVDPLDNDDGSRSIRGPMAMAPHQGPPQGVLPATTRFPPIAQAGPTKGPTVPQQQSPPNLPRTSTPVPQVAPPRSAPHTQGPRLGYFPDTRVESRSLLQTQPVSHEPAYRSSIAQQPPVQPQQRMEPFPQSSQTQLGHSRQYSGSSLQQPILVRQVGPPAESAPVESRSQQQNRVMQAPSSLRSVVQPFGPSTYGHSPAHSPITRPVGGLPPVKDDVRVNPGPDLPAAPRPPEPRKTSNIAALLNSEPEEPRNRKRYGDSLAPVSTTPRVPSPQPPLYQSQIGPTSHLMKGERRIEQPQTANSSQRGYSMASQPISRSLPELTAPSPQPSGPSPASQQSWYQRPAYQPGPPMASSPQTQAPYARPPSRPSYSSLAPPHAPSPPPQYAHSRVSQHPLPQQYQAHSAGHGPGQGVQPGPYSVGHNQPHPLAHQQQPGPPQAGPPNQPPPHAHGHQRQLSGSLSGGMYGQVQQDQHLRLHQGGRYTPPSWNGSGQPPPR